MGCDVSHNPPRGQAPASLTSMATTLRGLANVATGPSCVPKSPAPNLPAAAKEACAALESTESQLGCAQVSGTFPTTELSSGILARSHLGVNLHILQGEGSRSPWQVAPSQVPHSELTRRTGAHHGSCLQGKKRDGFFSFLLKNKTKQNSPLQITSSALRRSANCQDTLSRFRRV